MRLRIRRRRRRTESVARSIAFLPKRRHVESSVGHFVGVLVFSDKVRQPYRRTDAILFRSKNRNRVDGLIVCKRNKFSLR